MKMGICFAKVMALALSAVLFASNVSSEQVNAVENKSLSIVETNVLSPAQLMEIECPNCHEHFTAEINKTHSECPNCGHSNEFSG